MPDTQPPLIQVATMVHFVRAVERAELSAVALGQTVGITAEMFNDPRALAPAQAIYRYTELAAKELDEPNLGVKLGLDPAVTKWPVIADALANSTVLAEFFARFLLGARKFTTSVDFNLELGTERSWFRMDRGFTPPIAPSQIDAWWVGVFMTLFANAFEDGWQPSELLFRVCDPKVVRVTETSTCGFAKGITRIFEFSFPTAWLVRPVHGSIQTKPQTRTRKPPTAALISAIRSNIRANISDPNFGVADLVDQMGFNRRKVQKFLRDHDSGLADLIEQERKTLATELLRRGKLSLGDVAQALGYTDVSNFSRAFRRWTGVAPSRWREQHD